MAKHDTFLLRIDPVILKAVKQWAADELRSANGQIEFLLREALSRSQRLPQSRVGEGNGTEHGEGVNGSSYAESDAMSSENSASGEEN